MKIGLLLLLLIVVPNAWATWKVARSGQSGFRKALFIIMVWLVPLMGSWMVLREVRDAELPRVSPTDVPYARYRREHAPPSARQPGLEPFELREHLDEGSGPPLLDFSALDDWAATAATPEAVRDAHAEGLRVWLLYFRNWLGEQFELVDTHDCWVLSPYSPGMAGAAGRYMAESRRRVAQMLDGLAKLPEARGVMIVFDGEADYQEYLAKNYPAETFGPSVGMLINARFPHFVTLRGDVDEVERAITHETAHLALAHLSLPLWLDEGLAMHTTGRILQPDKPAGIDPLLLERHQAFWTADTLQEFWSGLAFHRGDDGLVFSLHLARVLVETMSRDRNSFTSFVTQARREDAGTASARSALSRELGELVATVLGLQADVSWNPRPTAWERIAIKA